MIALILTMILVGCSSSPTIIWLEEYESLLSNAVQMVARNPYSIELEILQSQISEKEAKIDSLLRYASMQEQMTFLSKYYDIRVKYYYATQ